MTLPEIAKLRLISQQLAGSKIESAVEMVQWLGAVQAQEYAQSKWGLSLRLPNITDKEIEKDFTEGKIVRTHILRPTWHFVAAQDIRWLLALSGPRVNAVNAYMYRQLELDETVLKQCMEILIKALTGGRQLTRDMLNEVFQKHKIAAKGLRLIYILMYAELAGVVCSGARQGNQFTYALMDERVPPSAPITKDEALAELTKRYFSSRGPATVKDYSAWSGLTLADCRKGVKMNQTHLKTVTVSGNEYYFSKTLDFNIKIPQEMLLLPVYDELIMGYKDRSAFFEFRNNLNPVPSIRFDCMIVSESQVIGTWKRTISKKSLDMAYEFFRPLNPEQNKAFENALCRLGAFTDLTINRS